MWNISATGSSGGARPAPLIERRIVPLGGLSVERLFELWGRVEFTASEGRVLAALQILQPRVEKVSFRQNENQAGFWVAVKLAGEDGAVPMASLGDGVLRAFGLLLALYGAKGGLLLIDEIDTGLHFRALEPLWSLLLAEAAKADVQIVATTHSEDAVRALARAAQGAASGDVAFIRLDATGAERAALVFDGEQALEMLAATELEVR